MEDKFHKTVLLQHHQFSANDQSHLYFCKTYLYEFGVAIIHIASNNIFSTSIVFLPRLPDFDNCGVNSSNKKQNVDLLKLKTQM